MGACQGVGAIGGVSVAQALSRDTANGPDSLRREWAWHHPALPVDEIHHAREHTHARPYTRTGQAPQFPDSASKQSSISGTSYTLFDPTSPVYDPALNPTQARQGGMSAIQPCESRQWTTRPEEPPHVDMRAPSDFAGYQYPGVSTSLATRSGDPPRPLGRHELQHVGSLV